VRFAAGTRLDVVMTKWGGRPHWEFAVTYLGSDGFGDWAGIPAGSRFLRPGAVFVAPVDQVTLVPRPGLLSEGRAGPCDWLASFHAEHGPVEVYVDVTTPAVFDGTTLRAVDLDLDVVRGNRGRVWVDDEDEFAEHRVAYGYPDDVVADALATCERVRRAQVERRPPYDGHAPRVWLERLASA
jgi:hypothetical protein